MVLFARALALAGWWGSRGSANPFSSSRVLLNPWPLAAPRGLLRSSVRRRRCTTRAAGDRRGAIGAPLAARSGPSDPRKFGSARNSQVQDTR